MTQNPLFKCPLKFMNFQFKEILNDINKKMSMLTLYQYLSSLVILFNFIIYIILKGYLQLVH